MKTQQHSWIVHKFGGTSLAKVERFHAVADILSDRLYGPQCVVVSALGGVTDQLLKMIDLAAAGDERYRHVLQEVRARHEDMATALLDGPATADYMKMFDRDRDDIADIARAAVVTGVVTEHTRGVVSGYGELWSAQLMQAQLVQRWDDREVEWLDARRFLVVGQGELGTVVDWSVSGEKLNALIPDEFEGTVIVTGYIAQDKAGHATTLGRNGSDYSASIMACLLDASQIHIWTDVDGVMTADPRAVADVQVIDELSYNEAMELAYFGAKVLHPQTMAPAVSRNIPIYIRNTFAPENPGTRIGALSGTDKPVKGITSIDGMAIVNVEGAGMIGVPGTAHRLFGGLAAAGISVVMISQGSSEHSICFAVRDEDADRAREVVENIFRADLDNGTIQRVSVTPGLSILAVVGDSMHGKTGIAAKVFGSLGHAGVNVRVIAQGSSERNISAIVDQSDATRAVRAVHSSFYLSPQTLSIGVIGCGTVGKVLLSQLASQINRLSSQFNLDLRVRGLARSTTMVLGDPRVNLEDWQQEFEAAAVPFDLQQFVDHIHAEHLPHAVIVDCTADAGIAAHYSEWFEAGIHVVTPNKKACSARYADYQKLQASRRTGDARFLYETTVGAGLPILQTVQDLRETGDRITRIQGLLSGTLAYLFNQFDGQRPFSEIVREARDSGFTEPDPRDDLSGMDVARKLTILGREMGLDLELEDVEVESLVPEDLLEVSIDEFMERLSDHDSKMSERLDAARQGGKLLRYVAELNHEGRATVSLKAVAADHAFAHISLTDNIVQFETERYCNNPLIVQGPGAGPDVTAAGVFADLLRLSAYLGAAV
ncbi:MAG: bifunctional aspartate kinase/homoserine dehydrogenase I [Gammaproteobacteria bacterium]|nr:bifunctional aspartate kinase/homoserine dehydrogenase I [Gammaproteobacteria bacterium]